MPLVKPSNTAVLKISLPNEVLEELGAYAEWAGASKARVVRTALQRLFKDDKEWKFEGKHDDDSSEA